MMSDMNVNIKIGKISDLSNIQEFENFSSLFKTLYYTSQIFFYGILPAWFLFGSYHRMKTLQY